LRSLKLCGDVQSDRAAAAACFRSCFKSDGPYGRFVMQVFETSDAVCVVFETASKQGLAYEPGTPLPSQSPLRPRSCASALFAHSLPSWECGWPASVDRKLHGQGTANMWSEATSSKRHTEYLYLCDLGLVGAAAKRGFGVQRRIKRARITIRAFENSTQTARAKNMRV
jgi:hypothetical protein